MADTTRTDLSWPYVRRTEKDAVTLAHEEADDFAAMLDWMVAESKQAAAAFDAARRAEEETMRGR